MKIFDYIMKGFFAIGIIATGIFIFLVLGKFMMELLKSEMWFVNLFIILFSISATYLFFKNRFQS